MAVASNICLCTETCFHTYCMVLLGLGAVGHSLMALEETLLEHDSRGN